MVQMADGRVVPAQIQPQMGLQSISGYQEQTVVIHSPQALEIQNVPSAPHMDPNEIAPLYNPEIEMAGSGEQDHVEEVEGEGMNGDIRSRGESNYE